MARPGARPARRGHGPLSRRSPPTKEILLMWLFSSRKTPRSQPARRVPPSHKPRLEVLEDRCLLSAGALDPTFGSGAGYVTTSITNSTDTAHQALIQPDGKIVATGGVLTSYGSKQGSVWNFGVARYNSDGS